VSIVVIYGKCVTGRMVYGSPGSVN